MFNFVLIALFVLNLAILLYIVLSGNGSDSSKESSQKAVENDQKIMKELSELKRSMSILQQFIHTELEQWREERSLNAPSSQMDEKADQKDLLSLNDRFKEIFDLHKQGYSAEEIAKELEKGNGEVSFILQLANQKQG